MWKFLVLCQSTLALLLKSFFFLSQKIKRPSVHGYAKVQKAHRSHTYSCPLYLFQATHKLKITCAPVEMDDLKSTNATHELTAQQYRFHSKCLCCRSDVCFQKISIIITYKTWISMRAERCIATFEAYCTRLWIG